MKQGKPTYEELASGVRALRDALAGHARESEIRAGDMAALAVGDELVARLENPSGLDRLRKAQGLDAATDHLANKPGENVR